MMLTNGWKKVKLGDVIKSLDAGVSVNSVDEPASKNSIGVLKTSCVSSGSFNPNENKAVVSADIDRVSVSVKADRIILSRMNSPSLVGANAYISSDFSNLYLPDRLWQLEPYPNKVNMRWLSYVLGRQETKNRFLNMATGTSNSMKNITKEDVLNLDISLPPIEEQKKIAATLSVWDSAIEKMEKLIDAKENELNIVLRQNLLGKGIALKWKEIPLTEILKSVTPPSKIHQDSYLNSGKYPIVDQSKDLIAGWTNDESSVLKINSPLIIFGDHTCALKIMHMPFAQGADGIKILSAKDGYDPTYIYYAIKANPIIPEGYKRHFSALMLKSILCPSLEEQKKYAVYFKSLDEEISLLKQQLENYKKQKQGLMQKLLTGQWRVK